MFLLGVNQIGLNFNIVLAGALRGAGDTRNVMIITVSRLWLIFVPLAYVFTIRMGGGIPGLWYSELISFAVFGTILLVRFRNRKWMESGEHDSSPEKDPEKDPERGPVKLAG